MGKYKLIDDLFDRLKAEVEAVIDLQVGVEKQKIMKRVNEYVTRAIEEPTVAAEKTVIETESQPVTETVTKDVGLPRDCGFCKRRGKFCVRHGGTSTVYQPKKKKPAESSEVAPTNRPLMDFVGKKDRTIDLPEVKINKGKSYSEYLQERGIKAPVEIEI